MGFFSNPTLELSVKVGGRVQGVLKVNGSGNAERFKHHMDSLIIYKLFKVEPIQNTVGLR